MGAIVSQITSLTIVYSTFYSDVDQRTHQSSASLTFVRENSPRTVKVPAQMASNAEHVSIWWRHHVYKHDYLNKHQDWHMLFSTCLALCDRVQYDIILCTTRQQQRYHACLTLNSQKTSHNHPQRRTVLCTLWPGFVKLTLLSGPLCINFIWAYNHIISYK